MSRRRRHDVRLPGGTVARVDRNLDSAQLARLIAAEERWLAQLAQMEERSHEASTLAEHGLRGATDGGPPGHGGDGGGPGRGRGADTEGGE